PPAHPLTPLTAELTIEELHPALMQKGGHVHAVGDEAHRVVLGPHLRPLIRAQPRRDRAVDAAHTVDVAGAVQGEARHVEQPGRGGCARQLEETLHRDAELADETLEVLHDELETERTVAPRPG